MYSSFFIFLPSRKAPWGSQIYVHFLLWMTCVRGLNSMYKVFSSSPETVWYICFFQRRKIILTFNKSPCTSLLFLSFLKPLPRQCVWKLHRVFRWVRFAWRDARAFAILKIFACIQQVQEDKHALSQNRALCYTVV